MHCLLDLEEHENWEHDGVSIKLWRRRWRRRQRKEEEEQGKGQEKQKEKVERGKDDNEKWESFIQDKCCVSNCIAYFQTSYIICAHIRSLVNNIENINI